MKQKLLIAMIVSILSSVCIRVSAENKIDWGMKLAVDAELPGKWKGDNNWDITMFRPGFGDNIGGVANIYLGKKFYFQPGLSLFYSGYKYKDLVISDAGGSVTESDPKLTKYGVQIPLLIGYQIDFSERFGLDVYTGPQMRYAFAGKIDIKNKALKEYLANTLSLWNTQRRFDLSWKIGIGFPIRDCILSVEADIGITNLLKEDLSFRENRVGIGFIKFFK